MHYQVLLVDDEIELAQSTLEYLAAFGVAGTHAASASEAEALMAKHGFDLILLDINMPGRSGFDFCRQVRATDDIPIIFISARASDDDEVLALGVGGDDYIRKPYSLNVLLAKVRRTLERFAGEADSFDDGWLKLDQTSRRVWVDGNELSLTAMEAKLLFYFAHNRGRVLTKQELMREVWQDSFVGDSTLTVHVRRLRTKVERDPNEPRYLRTVWGRGYLFEGEG